MDFTEGLNPTEKRWLAQAICGIILVDQSVSDTELQYLRTTMQFLKDKAEIDAMLDIVKTREPPLLQDLAVEKAKGGRMLMMLARIAISDLHFFKLEADYLKAIALKLGLPEAFTNQVLHWAVESVNLRKRERDLMKLLES